MTAARRLGLILVLFLSLPFLIVFQPVFSRLAESLLAHQPGTSAFAPHLAENLGRTIWLAVELFPVLVWKNLRDISSRRFGWSWAILVPALAIGFNLVGFGGWPAEHPWTKSLDILWLTLLIAANEEVIFRGYMFHDRPEFHPKLTILASSLTFALFHFVNLGNRGFDEVVRQVIFAFFMGLGLGTLRLATGNFWWCILVHWIIDASSDFVNAATSRWSGSVISLALPFWVILTLVVFAAHPGTRAALFAGEAFPVPPGRFRWLRWTATFLLGLAGGLAALIAVAVPLTQRQIATKDWVTVGVLVGIVALPCLLLAFAAFRWPHWRALPGRWSRDDLLPPPPDPTPPELQPAKVGAVLSLGLCLLISIGLALAYLLDDFKFSLHGWPSWQVLWSLRQRLAMLASSVVFLPLLTVFSWRRVFSPCSSRRTALVWMAAAGLHVLLIWLGATYVFLSVVWFFKLELTVWNLGLAGLVVSAFLALRYPLLPRRFDWMFPVAVALPCVLLARYVLTPPLDGWLQAHVGVSGFDEYSSELAWSLLDTFLLTTVALLPVFWKTLRHLGTLRLRWSWTTLLLLFLPGLDLAYVQDFPTEGSWPKTFCSLWSGLVGAAALEIILRGYLFHGEPRKHPRFVVIFSAVAYAVITLSLLPGNSWSDLVEPICQGLVFGLALGVVRLVTGSLGWGVLAAGMAGMANDFVVEGVHYTAVSTVIGIVGLAATVVVLWRHPVFQRHERSDTPVQEAFTAAEIIPILPSAVPDR